ncbi:MAG TPA: DUF4244 domain-containing protein [Mycobacteriales bacterium]|nr:DUF4244 domain-containing protein [Mycobacteriales bacterium]
MRKSVSMSHWIWRRLGGFVQIHLRRMPRGDAGMTTAEYAVGTLAACAFAAVLYKVVTSGAVLHALSRIVTSALDVHL